MTPEEIDIRLRNAAEALPKIALRRRNDGQNGIQTELELMNMQLMAITAMLGEIAKAAIKSNELQQ